MALLRKAGGGLERWIIPGLESTLSSLAEGGGRYPETVQIIPELLKSVQDLPVAGQWMKIRANVFATAARARAERAKTEEAAPRKAAEEATPARKPRRKARATPEKTTPLNATPRKTAPR